MPGTCAGVGIRGGGMAACGTPMGTEIGAAASTGGGIAGLGACSSLTGSAAPPGAAAAAAKLWTLPVAKTSSCLWSKNLTSSCSGSGEAFSTCRPQPTKRSVMISCLVSFSKCGFSLTWIPPMLVSRPASRMACRTCASFIVTTAQPMELCFRTSQYAPSFSAAWRLMSSLRFVLSGRSRRSLPSPSSRSGPLPFPKPLPFLPLPPLLPSLLS
mmetsp:Transcript_36757/g.105037  ORF Transcript_36757/g.105037 Transcript_36757/m.105037 type:complete len:213 (-) Transcript_36757:86-724(-)